MRFACLALVAAASTAFAQPQPEAKDGRVVIPLTLSPGPTPKPLSRCFLTPQYAEQQPGDQLSGFMKCFMEQRHFYSAEPEKLRTKFNETSLDELPKDSREQAGVMNGLAYGRETVGMMVNMDLAARYSRVEWNDYFHIRHDGHYWLIPEVQQMRQLAGVLKVRLRGEIKNGEFDRAIESVKSLTGLARMYESHPTVIGGLVGVAVQTIAWNGIEEMIARPGCPNLFWSLVEIPNPPFNAAKGYEGERTFTAGRLDFLLSLDRPLTDAEARKTVEFIAVAEGGFLNDVKVGSSAPRIAAFTADPKRVEAARRRLLDVGRLKPDAVKAFTPIQAILTDDVLSYLVLRDEHMKYRNLPIHDCLGGMAEAEKAVKAKADDLILAPLMLPIVTKAKSAEVRNAQRVAYLRVIEAIRLHAHETKGGLPEKLSDIKLSLPNDPISGKPFEYKVKDGVATLHGENPNPDSPVSNRYYELRIRK